MRGPAVATIADPPDPETVFARIGHLPHALWLDSSADVAGTGEWSFLGVDPYAVLQARGGHAAWLTSDGVRPVDRPVLAELAAELGRPPRPGPPAIPFDGGAAGFLAYETAGGFENLPPPLPRDHQLPDVHLAFYDVVVGWNHATGVCRVVSTGRPVSGRDAARRADRRLAETLDWLAGGGAPRPGLPEPRAAPRRPLGAEEIASHPVEGLPWLRSTATRDGYLEAVARIIDAIRDGEVYQVNLSQRFSARVQAPPVEIHRELRRRSPAPYGAVIRVGAGTVLSSSPERFLRVTPDGHVETRPIKGTRPRAADPTEDAALARELLASEKDRAENLMIVDLLRNDLSRVCRPGSIEVPGLFRLESWATVHHLVSVVRGRLREGVGPDGLLRATFPCGSVTGAPKLAAMDMIARHEHVARGPYCGAIGYFGFGGNVDLSVAIRILVTGPAGTSFHAGGGIVYDSEPADEYRETLAKARGIIDALAAVEEGARR